MGRQHGETRIHAEHVEAYLRQRVDPEARVTGMQPLGMSLQEGLKDYGYGRPIRICWEGQAGKGDLVLRTMSPDPFGHNRRADRADVLLLAFDTFNTIPEHIRALDVGAFGPKGELIPMERGEIFLVTDYVEGELYARDLFTLQGTPRDVQRAEALARYLVALHAQPALPEVYSRCIRDTIGSGEGLFGLIDSYPASHPVATPKRLQAIERAAVDWRWKLRDKGHRARRTHGDFHPFNILFREGVDLSVLDCSRGGEGEPADDVTALTLNYIFFALTQRGRFEGPYRELWDRFFATYLELSGDEELLEVVAPFFAWRGLVVASPVWYPRVADKTRDRLLRFVERLLDGEPFHPDTVDTLLT